MILCVFHRLYCQLYCEIYCLVVCRAKRSEFFLLLFSFNKQILWLMCAVHMTVIWQAVVSM